MTSEVLRDAISKTVLPLLSAVEAVSPGGPERKELAEFFAGCLKNGIQLNVLMKAVEALPVKE
jgi:hypothetical protein